MAALTLTVTTRALFGVTLGEEVREIGEMVNRAIALLEKPSDPQVKRSMDDLDGVVYHIIEQRRNNFEDGGDLLSSMILARDSETGETMADQQLRNQVMTLMLAGYETTASALTWTWYLLSQNREAFARLQAEARARYWAAVRLVTRTWTTCPSPARYSMKACASTLPPGRWAGRALGEDEIGGYYIAPGTTIAICLYTLHRHPRFWEAPDAFDPDRFSPERSAGRHKFAFIPFGAGPRQCIGNTFGLMESGLVLAHVAQHFGLELAPGRRSPAAGRVCLAVGARADDDAAGLGQAAVPDLGPESRAEPQPQSSAADHFNDRDVRQLQPGAKVPGLRPHRTGIKAPSRCSQIQVIERRPHTGRAIQRHFPGPGRPPAAQPGSRSSR